MTTMAVHTPVPFEVLTRFLQNYSLGKVIGFKGIAEGVENSNFLLETEKNRFILTLFEKRVKPVNLPFFIGVMEYLAQKNFPAPRPLPDKNGSMLQELQARPALIVSFLNGVSPEHPDASLCYAFGQGLAKLHLALQDCPLNRKNDFSLPCWTELFAKHREKAAQLNANLPHLIASDLEILQDNWPQGLPDGLVHADLFPDNALFLKKNLSGLIDFYFCCTDMLAYDFAISLNAWCLGDDGECDQQRAQALADGYQSVRPFVTAELEALPTLAQGAAMRFFLTRLADWNESARLKNPLNFAARLDFHRKAENFRAYFRR